MFTLNRIFMVICLCLSILSQAADKKAKTDKKVTDKRTVVWIEEEDDDSSSNAETKALKKRVARLERAVKQLQDKVFDLQQENPKEEEEVGCILETPFGEVYKAIGRTESRVRMDVYMQCRQKNTLAAACKKEKIKCKL